MDYTTGSFGPLDDRNINEIAFSNDYRLRQAFLSNNLSNPDYTRHSSALEYQAPRYAMHVFGLRDTLIHEALNIHREAGVNFAQEYAAKNAYKTLSTASIGFDALNVMGTIVGSKAAGLVGGAGASFLIGAAKDRYFDNYLLSQRINALTGNIRNQETGGMGLSGREITDTSKFIRSSASKDLLMDTKDYEDVLKTAFSHGMLDNIGSSSQFKSKASELAKVVKDLSDALGSSDFKGLVRAMSQFNSIGISSTAGQARFLKLENTASEYAGISQAAMHEQAVRAANNAKVTGLDMRMNVRAIFGAAAEMGLDQQSGLMSSVMNNKMNYLDASQNARITINRYNKLFNGGFSEDMKKVYAKYRAEETGNTAEEEYQNLIGMSNADQGRLMAEMTKRNTNFKYAYMNPNMAKAIARGVNTGDVNPFSYELANAIESVKSVYGKNASPKVIAQELQRLSFKSAEVSQMANSEGVNEFEFLTARVAAYQRGYAHGGKKGGLRELTRGDRAVVAKTEIEDFLNTHERLKEDRGLINTVERTTKGWMNDIGDFFVGFGASESIQDFSKNQREILLSRGRVRKTAGAGIVDSVVRGERLSSIDAYRYVSELSTHDTHKTDLLMSAIGETKKQKERMRLESYGINPDGFKSLFGSGQVQLTPIEEEVMDEQSDMLNSSKRFKNAAFSVISDEEGSSMASYRFLTRAEQGAYPGKRKYTDKQIDEIRRSIKKGIVPKFITGSDGRRHVLSEDERSNISRLYKISKSVAINEMPDQDKRLVEYSSEMGDIESKILKGDFSGALKGFDKALKYIDESGLSGKQKKELRRAITEAKRDIQSSIPSSKTRREVNFDAAAAAVDNEKYRKIVEDQRDEGDSEGRKKINEAIARARVDSSLSPEEKRKTISQLEEAKRIAYSRPEELNKDESTRLMEEKRSAIIKKNLKSLGIDENSSFGVSVVDALSGNKSQRKKREEELRKRIEASSISDSEKSKYELAITKSESEIGVLEGSSVSQDKVRRSLVERIEKDNTIQESRHIAKRRISSERDKEFKRLMTEKGSSSKRIVLSDGTVLDSGEILSDIHGSGLTGSDLDSLSILMKDSRSGSMDRLRKFLKDKGVSEEKSRRLILDKGKLQKMEADSSATRRINRESDKDLYSKFIKDVSDEDTWYRSRGSAIENVASSYSIQDLKDIYSHVDKNSEMGKILFDQIKSKEIATRAAMKKRGMLESGNDVTAFGNVSSVTNLKKNEATAVSDLLSMFKSHGKTYKDFVEFTKDLGDNATQEDVYQKAVSEFGEDAGARIAMQYSKVQGYAGNDSKKILGMAKGVVESANEWRTKVKESWADISGIKGEDKRHRYISRIDELLKSSGKLSYGELEKRFEGIQRDFGVKKGLTLESMMTQANKEAVLKTALDKNGPSNASDMYKKTGGDIGMNVSIISTAVKDIRETSRQTVEKLNALVNG